MKIQQLRINSINVPKEDSTSDDDSEQRPTKSRKLTTKKEETLDIQTCLNALLSHFTDFCIGIKEALLLTTGFLLFSYMGDNGIKLLILLFLAYQSILYRKERKTEKPNKINKVGSTKVLTKVDAKTIYDNLKIPSRNKLNLRKKVLAFRNKRSKDHQHLPEGYEDSLLIEEPIELPTYISKVPEHSKLMINGSVNDVPVTWEVDSGSCVTLISSDIFYKINNHEILHKIPLTVTYADFQGTTVKALGKYLLTIHLGEKVHTTHQVLVVEHPDTSQSHALLGVDMIRSKRLSTDHAGDSRVFLSFLVGENTKRIEMQTAQDCYIAQTTEIGGGEMGFIHVSLLNNINKICIKNVNEVMNTQGVVTCATKDEYKLPTVSLCNLDNTASFQLPVHNKQFGTLKFFKGETIGSFSPLAAGTLLQTTSNVFETIGKNHKRQEDLGSTILQLSETLQKVNPEKVKFFENSNNFKNTYIVKRSTPTEDGSPQNMPRICNQTIFLPQMALMSELNEWREVFGLMKSLHTNEVNINYSILPVQSANYIQIAFHERLNSPTNKLNLTHKDLQVHKTNLVSESSEEDAPSEDDLCEAIFVPRRITSSAETWTSLLKHVPNYLRKKVFYLLTSKYPDVIAKTTVDFGECTLPNSQFKIELKDSTPITCRPYPLNIVYESFVNETIQEMMDSGLLIQESSSYGSGVFVRSRPDSTGQCQYKNLFLVRIFLGPKFLRTDRQYFLFFSLIYFFFNQFSSFFPHLYAHWQVKTTFV